MFSFDSKTKTKVGPITGWKQGDLVQLREGSHGTPIGQVYEKFSDHKAVCTLVNLERVQDGQEIWLVQGPKGLFCATHEALQPKWHRWSGWPGAICLDCLQEDPVEWCVTDHDIILTCVLGHVMCMEGHEMQICTEHVNGPCLGPDRSKEPSAI